MVCEYIRAGNWPNFFGPVLFSYLYLFITQYARNLAEFNGSATFCDFSTFIWVHSIKCGDPPCQVKRSYGAEGSPAILFYTVSQKRDPYTFAHNLAKYWPILKIFFNIESRIKYTTKQLLYYTTNSERVATVACEITKCTNDVICYRR
jgi:hypothetical protein